jgi:hypothetical protein
MNSVKRVALLSMVALAVGFPNFGRLASGESAPSPGTRPAAETRPSDKVVATVNGEPVLESDLLAALPDDAFEDQLQEMKKDKLDRLIEETMEAQFLKGRKVTVPEDLVDKEIDAYRNMVTTPGCPCCGGGYGSLEQFMKVNSFSKAEFRQKMWNDVGLRLYCQQVARGTLSKDALAEAVKKHRKQIEADYIKCSVILFDATQNPTFNSDPDGGVSASKKKLARQAWQRLQANEPFEKVAKEMSDHKYSATDGGAVGCVFANMLGDKVENAWRKLKPGAYSDPVETSWGYCIVKREPFTEDDIMSLVWEKLGQLMRSQVLDEYEAARARAVIRSNLQ